MTETHRSSTVGAAPAAPFGEMPWQALGAVADVVEPLARHAVRTNMELTSLAGERARAYMALPEALSRCRTPFDLVQAQLMFWQEAGRQYSATAERLAVAWRGAGTNDAGDGRAEPRDFIGFPDGKPDAATDVSRRPGDTQRAA